MDNLVKKLSTGKHAIVFEPRTENIKEVKERLEEGFVFVEFTETQGGTELGINIDQKLTNLKEADFEEIKGNLKVAGTCELNFHKILCIADIDLATRRGLGYLELIDKQ